MNSILDSRHIRGMSHAPTLVVGVHLACIEIQGTTFARNRQRKRDEKNIACRSPSKVQSKGRQWPPGHQRWTTKDINQTPSGKHPLVKANGRKLDCSKCQLRPCLCKTHEFPGFRIQVFFFSLVVKLHFHQLERGPGGQQISGILILYIGLETEFWQNDTIVSIAAYNFKQIELTAKLLDYFSWSN